MKWRVMRLPFGIRNTIINYRQLLPKINKILKKSSCSAFIYTCVHYIEIFTNYLEKTYKKNATVEYCSYKLTLLNKYLLPSFKITSLYQLISPIISDNAGYKFLPYSAFLWRVPHSISRIIGYLDSGYPTKYTAMAKQSFDNYILPVTDWSASVLFALPFGRNLTLYLVHRIQYVHQKIDYIILSFVFNDVESILQDPKHDILKALSKEPVIAICKEYTFSKVQKSKSMARISSLAEIDDSPLSGFLVNVDYLKLAKKLFCNLVGESSVRSVKKLSNSLSNYTNWSLASASLRKEFIDNVLVPAPKAFAKTFAQHIESGVAKVGIMGNPFGYYMMSPLRPVFYDGVDLILNYLMPTTNKTEILIQDSPATIEMDDSNLGDLEEQGYIKIPNTENDANVPIVKMIETKNLVCRLMFNSDRIGGCFILDSSVTVTVTGNNNLGGAENYQKVGFILFSEDPQLTIVGASCI